ncbi:hypothetical protein [Candidatus Villigracilis vicinus]|uniref:amino acid kinase family protein n=1 Tax=Candidatus Villigracilis vicinus TaxID=3140679 RepID=UPI0031E9EFAC
MSRTLVMKFGGTSVGSADALKSAIQIIRDAKKDWERVVVVTSAMSGVTNLLLDSAASASQGKVDSLPATESSLREKHFAAADALIKDESLREQTKSEINALILLARGLVQSHRRTRRSQSASDGHGGIPRRKDECAFVGSCRPRCRHSRPSH